MEQILGKWLCELICGFSLVPDKILVMLQIMLDMKGTSLSDVSLMLEEMFMKFKGEVEHLKQNYNK